MAVRREIGCLADTIHADPRNPTPRVHHPIHPRSTHDAARLLLLAFLLPLQTPAEGPAYTPDGQLKYPANYPEWVFLGTGIDMSYRSATPVAEGGMSMFNSVFVNPSAWKSFKQTGHWPEGTVMVLENRAAAGDISINKRGKTETSELMGLEVHVLDSARQKGGWAFFNFDAAANPQTTGKLIPRPADCYTCHEQHGAVDTTFTQFYPRALAIAKERTNHQHVFESAAKVRVP